MKNRGTHTGSFDRNESGIIVRARYYFSKWDKELGEKIVIDGNKTLIEVIGDSRNNVIDKMNILIKESNNIARK